jgi:hypothetical protein
MTEQQTVTNWELGIRRPKGGTCGSCRHWKRFNEQEGFCKRYPPYPVQRFVGDDYVTENLTPTTLQDDSCGEHNAR